MFKFINILIIVFALHLPDKIDDIRAQYFQIDSLEKADYYIDQLKNESSIEARAYTAALYFTKYKLYNFPFKKMKYFKKGKSMLEKVISERPSNVELRYIRYCLQKRVPDFIGYNANLQEDLNLILKNMSDSDMSGSIKSIILNNILFLNDLTEKDKMELNLMLKRL